MVSIEENYDATADYLKKLQIKTKISHWKIPPSKIKIALPGMATF